MKFGIILLSLVMAFSLIGSLLPQDRAAELFSAWYFVLLICLICALLVICCAKRLRYLAGLKENRFRSSSTFIIHLSVLCILVFGGIVLTLSDANNHSIMPGQTIVLPDGTALCIESFRIADEAGRTDFVSEISITAPSGGQARGKISVNNPMTFDSKKYYQHSYGTAGLVTAVNTKTGGEDVFYLTERSFLSVDGRNGIWFDYLFQGLVYQIMTADDGVTEYKMAFPGDEFIIGDVAFIFNEPENYPGILVKSIPAPFPVLLYLSFGLMTAGLALYFFYAPQAIAVREEEI